MKKSNCVLKIILVWRNTTASLAVGGPFEDSEDSPGVLHLFLTTTELSKTTFSLVLTAPAEKTQHFS